MTPQLLRFAYLLCENQLATYPLVAATVWPGRQVPHSYHTVLKQRAERELGISIICDPKKGYRLDKKNRDKLEELVIQAIGVRPTFNKPERQ